MKKLLIAAIALGVIAGPAAAAAFPEKASSRVYWKPNQFIVSERTAPLAIQGTEDNFTGGYYNHGVTPEPATGFSHENPPLHLPNR